MTLQLFKMLLQMGHQANAEVVVRVSAFDIDQESDTFRHTLLESEPILVSMIRIDPLCNLACGCGRTETNKGCNFEVLQISAYSDVAALK